MTMGLWWIEMTILENKKYDIGEKIADKFFLGELLIHLLARGSSP